MLLRKAAVIATASSPNPMRSLLRKKSTGITVSRARGSSASKAIRLRSLTPTDLRPGLARFDGTAMDEPDVNPRLAAP